MAIVQPLRVLPVLVVLAGVFTVAKTAELGFAVEAALDPVAQAPGDAPPLTTAAGPAATLRLPQLPEAGLEAAAGEELGAEPEAVSEPAAAEAADQPAEDSMTASGGLAEATVRDPFDVSDEELELLQRLMERREALERRARNLDQRETLLAATEARIADKMGELKALQALIESLLVQHDEQEEARLASLVKIYESMKPKEAARIFDDLDMVVLLEVIGRMKERKSAPILAKMDPRRAKAITLELAQRRELPVARQ